MASFNSYTGDGSTRNRAITFPYIDRSHVVVTRDGVETDDWEWFDSSTIQFDTAAAIDVVERIQRVTPGDERIVEFENGSALLDANLNTAALQALYVAEEARDRADESIVIDPETNEYDFGGHRGTNAADPEDPQDLATKAYADSILNQVADQVAVAASHADSASSSAATTTTQAAIAVDAKADAEAAQTGAEDAQAAVELLLAGFDPDAFATAEQGGKADTALQPNGDGSGLTGIVSVPVGATIYVNGTTAPTGFLKENGAELSRTTFAALWAFAQASGRVVSEAAWAATDWGAFSEGDGTTTFRIPDSRGEFVRALDDGRGVDSGRALGSRQTDTFQDHEHAINGSVCQAGSNQGMAYGKDASMQAYVPVGTFTYTTKAGGSGTRPGTETRGRNVSKLACIKY